MTASSELSLRMLVLISEQAVYSSVEHMPIDCTGLFTWEKSRMKTTGQQLQEVSLLNYTKPREEVGSKSRECVMRLAWQAPILVPSLYSY
jgi:hypothetical protein